LLVRAGGGLPESLLHGAAAALGRLQAIVPSKRRVLEANLRLAFPELSSSARRRLARVSCVHVLKALTEVLCFARNPEWLRERLPLETDAWNQVAAWAETGPCIFVAPHLGNWELVAQGVVLRGIPMCAVARPIRNPRVDALVRRVRTQLGLRVIPSHGAVRELSRVLRSGCHAGIVVDQNVRPRAGGVFVDFFGLPAATSPAPAALARRYRARLVCAALVRQGRRFELVLSPLERDPAEYDDNVSLTADLVRCMERLIRRHAEQYMWHYPRWRYIPPDATPEMKQRYPEYARIVET